MENMQQEIKSVEQALVTHEWNGDLRKYQFDTDWQGRKNRNYKIIFRPAQNERRIDVFVSMDYCQKPMDGGLCYKVESKRLDGRNTGRFGEFDRALKFFLTQVEGGMEDFRVPEVEETKKNRGKKRQTGFLSSRNKAA